MIRYLLTFLCLLLSANSAFAFNLGEGVDKYLAPVSDAFSKVVFYDIPIFDAKIPISILWILIGGIMFTLLLKGIALWGFKHASMLLLKKPTDGEKSSGSGEVSSLQALSTALSGTIGIGNIAGVAIAISIGGPGAAFWMFVGAFLGMSLKFVEASLAVKYRRFNADGSVSGGPMYYISHGLTRKNLRWLGQPLALIFAVLLIPGALGGGNMLQVNQATAQVINIAGGESSFLGHYPWIVGLVVAVVVGFVIVGGIKSIANVTSKIVPFMCMLYVGLAFLIIVLNFTQIPHAIWLVIKQAFVPDAVYGGVAGTIIIGLRRSVQSNEAGTGSAPIAYATVKTKEPISQGFVSLLEPFLTACLCSLSGAAIILTGAYKNYQSGISGVELTSEAFQKVFEWAPYVLAAVIILFALSTIISWAYYGQKGWTYLFGENKKGIIIYQIIFCLTIVIGSTMNLKSIVDFTDAGLLAMAVPNIIAMYILFPDLKKDIRHYCKKHRFGEFY